MPGVVMVNEDRKTFSNNVVRNYKMKRQMQLGGHSFIYEATDLDKNIQVAIKLLPVRNKSERRQYLSERNTTSRLSEKSYSVTLYDHFIEQEWGFLVMELHSKDLLNFFNDETNISPQLFKFFIHHICRAVDSCHRRNIVHLDIKPENILLNQELQPILCDYGCSRTCGTSVHISRNGTIQYRAPEISDEYKASPSADVWSIGVLLFVLSTGNFFPNETLPKDFLLLPQHLPKHLSDTLKDLICMILKQNPSDRPTVQTILAHGWFNAET